MSKKTIKKRSYVNDDGNPVTELIQEYEYDQSDVDDAYGKFTEEKEKILNMMRKAGVNEENIDDLSGQITTPEQLEIGKSMALSIARGAEAHGGSLSSDPQNPPGGSVVRLPSTGGKRWVYASAKEAIDDLYEKLQNGSAEEKKFADKALNAYFQKIKPTMDAGKLGSFSMSACPGCGYALMGGTNTCPYCGLDVAKYRQRGGTLYDDSDEL